MSVAEVSSTNLQLISDSLASIRLSAMKMNRKNIPSGLLLTLALLFSPAALADGNTLSGQARDIKSGRNLYQELHTFSVLEGERKMHTAYISPDKEMIAERTVHYRGDQVAHYTLLLTTPRYRESVVRSEARLRFEISEADQPSRNNEVTLQDPQNTVIDAGFNDYLLRNWDVLLDGKRLRFDFASTEQMDAVRLQVRHDGKLSTDNVVMFSMTAANPLYRLLMQPIKVGFYQKSRQLAYYHGVSNMRDDSGEAYDVEITFDDGQYNPYGAQESGLKDTIKQQN